MVLQHRAGGAENPGGQQGGATRSSTDGLQYLQLKPLYRVHTIPIVGLYASAREAWTPSPSPRPPWMTFRGARPYKSLRRLRVSAAPGLRRLRGAPPALHGPARWRAHETVS